MTRSLSRNMSAEDTDELSEHIILKARSKAFAWSKGLCLFLIVFYAMIYSHSKNEIHAVLFVGCTLMLVAMIIIEAITEFYYNRKMEK